MDKKINLSDDLELTSSTPDDKRLSQTWGYVTAYPHEYLIHFRNGRLNEKNSGQGATCFKFPRDTVFIVPTSLKEIIFQANQLSSDNVDVRIRGMAVYRIAKPLKIYSKLNFSNRQRAEEKLARMIGDLCRSTSKWLVANMQLEECLRQRKEDIAGALKKEVSLIVADEEKGWGVEIVTIDIQDVYIQDAEIFNAMQAQFKTEKMRESQLVQLEMKKDLEIRKLEQERTLAEHRKNNELEKARIDAELKQEQLRLAQASEEKQFALDRYRVEQNEQIVRYKQEQEMERERRRLQLKAEADQQEIEAKKLALQTEIEGLQKRIEVENTATPISLEKDFIEKALPSVAGALAQSMENAHLHIYQGGEGGTPFKFILTELLDLMRERLSRAGDQK